MRLLTLRTLEFIEVLRGSCHEQNDQDDHGGNEQGKYECTSEAHATLTAADADKNGKNYVEKDQCNWLGKERHGPLENCTASA